jgi:Xaa-Pro aminopeptidase
MNRLPVIILLLLISRFSFAQWDDKDVLSPEFHQGRREALRATLPPNSAAIIFSNPVRNRSNDVDYAYHQDPDFYYFTGYLEPDAMVIIFKEEQTIGSLVTNEILFVQERNPANEIWTGLRLGTEGASSRLKWKTVYNNSEFKYAEINLDKLQKLLVTWPDDPNSSAGEKCDLLKKIAATKIEVSKNDLKILTGRLREVKMPGELELLKKAINITTKGFLEMIKNVKPGMKEYQVQANGEYVFKTMGAEDQGYGAICGGGHNGCVLHYTFNRKELTADDMILVDMGAEYHGYTADITRTFPVDGHFSEQEKVLYQLVYDAQEAGLNACQPGNAFRNPHEAAFEVISKGLKKLGITKNESETQKYFMHGTSHYLGLDVHDPGTYGPLKPNSVITVEPGIYIPEGSACDKKWWNIGVRIEDDVLITQDGYEVLSGHLARSIADIERLFRSAE